MTTCKTPSNYERSYYHQKWLIFEAHSLAVVLHLDMHHHRYSNAHFCLNLVYVVINILHAKCVDYTEKDTLAYLNMLEELSDCNEKSS